MNYYFSLLQTLVRYLLLIFQLFSFWGASAQLINDSLYKSQTKLFLQQLLPLSYYGRYKWSLEKSYGKGPIVVRQAATVDAKLDQYKPPKLRKIFLTETSGDYHNLTITDLDSLEFTMKEWDTITAYIKQMPKLEWTIDNFEGAAFIEATIIDSLNKGLQPIGPFPKWNIFPHGYFEFSAPLFLRNGSVVLFYWKYYYGNKVTEGGTSVYVQKEGTWVEFPVEREYNYMD